MLVVRLKWGGYVWIDGVFLRADESSGGFVLNNARVEYGIDELHGSRWAATITRVNDSGPKATVYTGPERAPPEIAKNWPRDDRRLSCLTGKTDQESLT